jgi:adenosylmethionine-8-amino-7-oxononanoate aminotransferase
MLVQAGVWVRPFRNIVYLTPAFTIGEDELGVLTAALVGVVSHHANGMRASGSR